MRQPADRHADEVQRGDSHAVDQQRRDAAHDIANSGNQIGINGSAVTNLVMTGVEVMNFGNGADEHGVQLHNLWAPVR